HRELQAFDGAVWDGRTWKRIEPCPIQSQGSCWTEAGLFVWGGSTTRSAFWDAESNAWRRLPQAPEKKGQWPTCVALGTRVLIWGGSLPFSKGEERRPVRDGILFDSTKGSWEKIPEGGPLGAAKIVRKLAGRLMAWDGESGASYDPQTGRWTEMLPSPFGQHSA